jgi:23S rRNA C2498 (ribose-2'-O)-methylase RlmM
VSAVSSSSRGVVDALRSLYVFALCQPGAEAVTRAELQTLGLSPSFSAPGFVTAKAARELTTSTLPRPVFARRLCLSLPAESDGAVLAARLGGLVHREQGAAGERGPAAADGDVVVTVAERGRAFVGVHVQGPGVSRDPAGDGKLVVPPHAPSRAWLKLEEAARVWPLPLGAGDAVVEVGCAPGGMTRALLDRGAFVLGIDANAMDERVRADPHFRHLRSSVRNVEASLVPSAVPGPVRLLVVDMNLPPNSALSALTPVARAVRSDLRAALFTLKLGDWSLVPELPAWRTRIEKMLSTSTTRWTTTATQLPSNRQEITVYATPS